MKVQFKFRENIEEAARQSLIRALDEHGATAVRRLFPDDTGRELASLYVVDVPDDSTSARLLRLLRTSPAVEFVERETRRKLIP